MIPKKEAFYKNKRTKLPNIIYEVWKEVKGEYLVDVWHIKDKTKNLYVIYDTVFLKNFKKHNLEQINATGRVIQNYYLRIDYKTKCEQCWYYEKPTKDDQRESCSKLVDVLADVTKAGTMKGFTVILDSKEIKKCDYFYKRNKGE